MERVVIVRDVLHQVGKTVGECIKLLVDGKLAPPLRVLEQRDQ